MLMDPDGGTVDHHQFAVESLRDRRQKPIPHTRFAPADEAVVAGGVRTIALGNVSPGAAGAKPPQYPVDHPAIIHPRYAAWLVGKQRLDHRPLEIGQLKTTTHLQGSFPEPGINQPRFTQHRL